MGKLGIRAKFAIMSILTVLLSVGITTAAVLYVMEQDMERQAKVFQETKLRMLHQMLDQKGHAKVVDGNLVFGDYVVNNNFEIVDKMKDIPRAG
jgi:hypothetical protein